MFRLLQRFKANIVLPLTRAKNLVNVHFEEKVSYEMKLQTRSPKPSTELKNANNKMRLTFYVDCR